MTTVIYNLLYNKALLVLHKAVLRLFNLLSTQSISIDLDTRHAFPQMSLTATRSEAERAHQRTVHRMKHARQLDLHYLHDQEGQAMASAQLGHPREIVGKEWQGARA